MNLAVVSLASFPRRQPHQRFSRRSQNQPADQRTVKITDTTPRDAALRSRNVSLRGLVAEPVAAGRGDLVKSRVKGVMAKDVVSVQGTGEYKAVIAVIRELHVSVSRC